MFLSLHMYNNQFMYVGLSAIPPVQPSVHQSTTSNFLLQVFIETSFHEQQQDGAQPRERAWGGLNNNLTWSKRKQAVSRLKNIYI